MHSQAAIVQSVRNLCGLRRKTEVARMIIDLPDGVPNR